MQGPIGSIYIRERHPTIECHKSFFIHYGPVLMDTQLTIRVGHLIEKGTTKWLIVCKQSLVVFGKYPHDLIAGMLLIGSIG